MDNKLIASNNINNLEYSIFSEEDVRNFLNNNLIDFGKANEELKTEQYDTENSYSILIVDDEPDVHKITKLNLNNFSFNNKSLEFSHAYSAQEAEKILKGNKEIALIFLDVVMETNDAGLQLVQFIRQELNNKLTQIVLHTGQPGQAPEKEVIAKYDINSYQTKTEFTENRIYTVTAASLRAYDALKQVKEYSETLEVKVAERTQKLQETLDAKNKLFSIIAHDLRNPFNTLLGFAYLILHQIDQSDKNQIIKYAKTIHSSAQNIFNLLTNLLEWARTQTGSIEVKIEKTNMNTVIKENLKIYDEIANIKSNKLIFEAKEDFFVQADLNMLNTILRNLLYNAIKYTKEGEILISLAEEGKMCKITIADSGIGIEKERLNNLFKIGNTLSTKGTDKEKGTGLGLHICKEFLTLNNGTIEVESEVNKGSKFSFTLPVYFS